METYHQLSANEGFCVTHTMFAAELGTEQVSGYFFGSGADSDFKFFVKTGSGAELDLNNSRKKNLGL